MRGESSVILIMRKIQSEGIDIANTFYFLQWLSPKRKLFSLITLFGFWCCHSLDSFKISVLFEDLETTKKSFNCVLKVFMGFEWRQAGLVLGKKDAWRPLPRLEEIIMSQMKNFPFHGLFTSKFFHLGYRGSLLVLLVRKKLSTGVTVMSSSMD